MSGRKLASLVLAIVSLFLLVRIVAARSGGSASSVVYGAGSLDPESPGGITAIEMPSGQILGRFSDIRRQGGSFALAPDGKRAYLLDGEYFYELETPSLRMLRRATLSDHIGLHGDAEVIAVSPDGKHVFVETLRIIGPPRLASRLRIGQSDAEYGIAVYDVAQEAFTRQIPLDPPWCGVAQIFAAPRYVEVFCPSAQEVRLIDPSAGRQIASIGLADDLPRGMNLAGWSIRGISGLDGRRFWVVRDTGTVAELSLDRLVVTRTGDADVNAGKVAPIQSPRLSADGKYLFVPVAPDAEEMRARGLATRVWIVELSSLRRVGEVRLPAPAIDVAPTPDGQALFIRTTNTSDQSEWGTRLVEVPTGKELRYWPGEFAVLAVR